MPAPRRHMTEEDKFELAAMKARGVTHAQIARQLKMSYSTIEKWINDPELMEMTERCRVGLKEAVKHTIVGDQKRRVMLAQRMIDRILDLIAKRAASAEERLARGEAWEEETTGLTTREETTRTQTSRSGAVTTTMTVRVRHDSSLHDQLRRWLEYAAREQGDLIDGLRVTHAGQVEIVEKEVDYSRLSDDEVEMLARLRQKVWAEEMTAT